MYHQPSQFVGLFSALVVITAVTLTIWDLRRSRQARHRHDGLHLNRAQRRMIARDLTVVPVFRPENHNGDLRRAKRSGHL